MCEEDPDGFRTLNYAVRVWPSATGRKMEQLGWPEIDIRYRSGTRIPEGATLHLKTIDRKPLDLEIECLTGIPLHLGCGYGSGDGWSHGMWMGESWVNGRTYDYADPEIQAKVPWGGTDHLARATLDGQTGYGVFEHGTVGRHLPSGHDRHLGGRTLSREASDAAAEVMLDAAQRARRVCRGRGQARHLPVGRSGRGVAAVQRRASRRAAVRARSAANAGRTGLAGGSRRHPRPLLRVRHRRHRPGGDRRRASWRRPGIRTSPRPSCRRSGPISTRSPRAG